MLKPLCSFPVYKLYTGGKAPKEKYVYVKKGWGGGR